MVYVSDEEAAEEFVAELRRHINLYCPGCSLCDTAEDN